MIILPACLQVSHEQILEGGAAAAAPLHRGGRRARPRRCAAVQVVPVWRPRRPGSPLTTPLLTATTLLMSPERTTTSLPLLLGSCCFAMGDQDILEQSAQDTKTRYNEPMEVL